MSHAPQLGIGIGWRPEIADAVEALPGIDWVEAVAENVCADHLPDSLVRLRARGVTVVPHGVFLGLGGATRPDAKRLADLSERAEALGSPLITEHIAFVRAGGPLTASPVLEAGHLLPVPRTKDALRVLCENVRIAQDSLPVPLAVENIAALINWPDEEMTEGQFLAELVERTGVRLLIDVANLHTNHVNRGEDPVVALGQLPVEAIAYVHVAGGIERDGVWHDTHAHPVTAPVLDVLAQLRSRVSPPGVLLERDDNFPPTAELSAELDTIRTTLRGPGPASAPGAEAAGPSQPPVPPVAPHAARAVRPGTTGITRTASRSETGGERADAGGEATGPRDPRGAPHPAKATRPQPTAATDATDPGGTGSGPAGTEAETTAPRNPQEAPHPAKAAGPEPTAATDATDLSGAGHGPATVEGGAPGSPGPAGTTRTREPVASTDPARERLALAQTALLSSLVAGTPAPEGFDSQRLGVQSRALAVKRAEVVAKVAPELPLILGDGYRGAFLAYAKSRPMRAGYRRDALDFAEHLLIADRPDDPAARRELTQWWRDRAGARPPGRAVRIARAARAVLVGR